MAAAAVGHEHRVTPRELFFDLVFVFAFTQVATLLADDPTFTGLGHGVLVLAALWWAWAAFAALTNNVDPEEGVIGAALLVALIAMFVAALVVPGVFDDEGVLFGAAFLVVCAMHLALYALAGRGDRALLAAVLRLAPSTLIGAILILLAGFLDDARIWLWLVALAWTYIGAGLSGTTGWHVHPYHFAERYGLVLIIAIGEAFISLGIGVTGIGIGLGEVVAAVLGLLVAVALCGGSALDLLAYSAIRMRVLRRVTVSRGRFVAALALLLLIPLATAVPALAALALVTAVWVALHTYELVWWREARAEARSLLASSS